MIRLYLLCFIMALGCRSSEPAPGTSVGNPGKLSPSVGQGEGVEIGWAWGVVDAIVMRACDGTTTEISVDAEIEFDGSEEIEIPGGSYCSAQLVMAEALELDALWRPTTDSLLVHLHLPLEDTVELSASSTFTVDDDALILEVGGPGWLHEDDLDVDFDGQEFDEETDDSLAAAAAAVATSALWRDDGDGLIDDEEREDGPIASPGGEDEPEGKSSTQDSGCTTVPSAPSGLLRLWMCALMGWRRTKD